jgi:hypothetical protein
MITGAHVPLYTSEPEASRAMLRDVFGFTWVDAREGWLIFRPPPANSVSIRQRGRAMRAG